MTKKFDINIPTIQNDTIKLFVNGEYKGEVTFLQSLIIRKDVTEYIIDTNDKSILDTFYFIGHVDSNDVPGKEIKLTMDMFGNLSGVPFEQSHIRRSMYECMKGTREHLNVYKEREERNDR